MFYEKLNYGMLMFFLYEFTKIWSLKIDLNEFAGKKSWIKFFGSKKGGQSGLKRRFFKFYETLKRKKNALFFA